MFRALGLLGALCAVGIVGAGVAGAVNPEKVPSVEVYGKDGERVEAPNGVSFAVVGATRTIGAGIKAEPDAPLQIIKDIRTQSAVQGLDFVLLTGGYVRRSTIDEWVGFGERWRDVLDLKLRSQNQSRRPAMAIPGDAEYLGDKKLTGYGGAFPGASAGIGFNRNASWGKVDVTVGKTRWRLLMLDTHQRAMGSRWKEQLFWLPNAVSDGEFDKLVVVMSDPRVTMADGATMDRNDGPSQLIEIIEEYAPLNALTVVISGGPATNEWIQPTGAYGEAYLVAGNAGIGMPTLLQANAADDAGFKDVGLEPLYTVSLMNEFDRQHSKVEFQEAIVDKAKGRGEWETYTPRFDGGAFPIQGWWKIDIDRKGIAVTFRMLRPDGSLADIHKTRRGSSGGWRVEAIQ